MQGYLFDVGKPTWDAFVDFDVVIREPDDRRRAVQLAMLDRMLQTGRHTAVCDVLRDLDATWSDGGYWVGPAVRQLCDDGIIDAAGLTYSRRLSRNGCPVHNWTLTDPEAAKQRAEQLRSTLQLSEPKRKDDSSAASTDEPSCSKTANPKGVSRNGEAK
ncbi:MAG: hypothetical protein ACE361_17010 [Aureliella sp.]